jgi:hypothetical protein
MRYIFFFKKKNLLHKVNIKTQSSSIAFSYKKETQKGLRITKQLH